jgi:hypothetical protein
LVSLCRIFGRHRLYFLQSATWEENQRCGESEKTSKQVIGSPWGDRQRAFFFQGSLKDFRRRIHGRWVCGSFSGIVVVRHTAAVRERACSAHTDSAIPHAWPLQRHYSVARQPSRCLGAFQQAHPRRRRRLLGPKRQVRNKIGAMCTSFSQ